MVCSSYQAYHPCVLGSGNEENSVLLKFIQIKKLTLFYKLEYVSFLLTILIHRYSSLFQAKITLQVVRFCLNFRAGEWGVNFDLNQ